MATGVCCTLAVCACAEGCLRFVATRTPRRKMAAAVDVLPAEVVVEQALFLERRLAVEEALGQFFYVFCLHCHGRSGVCFIEFSEQGSTGAAERLSDGHLGDAEQLCDAAHRHSLYMAHSEHGLLHVGQLAHQVENRA